MKVLGGILVAAGAIGAYLEYRKSAVRTLRLLRALAEDLALMRLMICIHRRALPDILTSELSESMAAEFFWLPLAGLIAQSGESTIRCWEKTVALLPPLVGNHLLPLGKFLPVGGDELDHAIAEVRREMIASAHELQERQPGELRLSAALCFSASALFILIFA